MWKKLGRFGLMCAILAFPLVGMVVAQAEIPSVTVTVTADGLSAPEALPEGFVNVTFDNISEAPFVGVVFQLNDGVTMDDVFASMAEGDPMGFLPLVRLKGGPGVMPGQSVTMTYALEAGNYALLNFFGEMPQVAPFNVTEGEDVMQVEPATDLNVVLTDFVFGLPATLPAGSSVWQLTNSGSQWHELAIASVDAGTTAEDVLALLAEGEPWRSRSARHSVSAYLRSLCMALSAYVGNRASWRVGYDRLGAAIRVSLARDPLHRRSAVLGPAHACARGRSRTNSIHPTQLGIARGRDRHDDSECGNEEARDECSCRAAK